MLLVNNKNVNLIKTYQKIFYVMPALNQTYCFLGMKGHRQDCVVHLDDIGNILFEHVFSINMDSFGMMNEQECILLETRNNCISFLNLTTHTFKKVPFNFLNQQTDQSFIYTFPDTKYLCIRENGRYNDSRLKFSYFTYPLEPNAKPFKVFFSQTHWTYQYVVRKTNNHSQFTWLKGRHDQNFQIYVYDLKENQDSQIKKYVFKNKIGQPYSIKKVQCAIKNIWELRPYQFMLVCDTDRNKPQGEVINNNYVLDIKSGNVRECKFRIPNPIYQQMLIDHKYLGEYSMFRTFSFENGNPLQTPVYYINNQREELVGEQLWKCSYKTKYSFPGYDGGMLCECEYQNGDVNEIRIMTKKIVRVKDTILHFMVELNEDFDSDLLKDVIEMIDYSK